MRVTLFKHKCVFRAWFVRETLRDHANARHQPTQQVAKNLEAPRPIFAGAVTLRVGREWMDAACEAASENVALQRR